MLFFYLYRGIILSYLPINIIIYLVFSFIKDIIHLPIVISERTLLGNKTFP